MDVDFNRNSDLVEESLEDVLNEGGEPSCEDFFVDGKCPKSRYLSTDCPMYFGCKKDYEMCIIEKEA
jgi:hypothetical protein